MLTLAGSLAGGCAQETTPFERAVEAIGGAAGLTYVERLQIDMIGATVWWFARLAARAGTERPSATERVVAHPQLGGSETQGASAGQEVAFDSPLQGASPTRRGPHPVGSSITAAG